VGGTRVSNLKGLNFLRSMLIVTTAMVTKVSARNHGGEVRLKAAASFADSGDIHDVVEELWKGAGAKKQTLIDTVRHLKLRGIHARIDEY
jgi:hypothetical protein